MKDFFIDPEGKNVEQVRRIGYELVDLIAEHFSSLLKHPVFKYATPKELNSIFSETVPQKGMKWSKLLDEIKGTVLKHSFYFGHPRYVGHMITQPAVPSIFLESLIAALNQSAFLWEVGPATAHLEKEVIEWLCTIFGYGRNAGGSFVTGGSVANLTALLIARNYILSCPANTSLSLLSKPVGFIGKEGLPLVEKSPVFFTSEYSHFSLQKAANFIGIGEKNLILVPGDKNGKMNPAKLEELIEESMETGKYPFCVVATAGTTVAGVIDPISAVADICNRYGLWLHVDAAFGGALSVSSKWRHLLDGIEMADSITFDPHKWLYNSISSATILLKDSEKMRYLQFKAPYIEEPEHEEGKRPNQGECTIQGTRAFDALKLWACLKLIGLEGYEKIIDHCIDLTHYLEELLAGRDDMEVISAPETSILCFRYNPPEMNLFDVSIKRDEILDHVNLELQKRLESEGKAFVSVATFKGRKVLRAVILNYCTQKEDIDFVVQEVGRIGRDIFQKLPFP